jgi:hypothetical protein
MMNKVKSARVHLVRFLFVVPVLALIIVAFRGPGTTQKNDHLPETIVSDTVPKSKGMPERIRSIQVNKENATITLKNGQVEYYDLTVPAEKKAFLEIIGSIELPAPPTPPQAPVAGAGAVSVSPDGDVIPAKAEYDCYNSKGYCITIADNMGECVVIVKDKQGKILEAVKLTDWNKDKKYEQKYGDIPPPPPPAPPADVAPVPVAAPARPAVPAKSMDVRFIQVAPGVPVTSASPGSPAAMPADVRFVQVAPLPVSSPSPAAPAVAPLPEADVKPVRVVPAAPAAPAGPKLPKNAKKFQINNKRAIIEYKNGTVEEYDLSKPDEKAKFEEKYGRVAQPAGAIDEMYSIEWH